MGAPHEKGEEPENDDGNENGSGRRQSRRAEEPVAGGLVRNDAVSKEAADNEPNGGGYQRHEEWRARRSLLKGEDQTAD